MKKLSIHSNFHLNYLFGQKLDQRERFVILVESPHIQSPANLILLKNYYSKICIRPTKLPTETRVWLTFRNKFLKRIKKMKGELDCFYCKQTGLISNTNVTPSPRLRATIDHYTPLAKGGKRFDESNLRVCCEYCNAKKKDLTPEAFMLRIKKLA